MLYRTAGQFKTSYVADQALFPVKQDAFLLAVLLLLAWMIFPMTASEFAFQTLLIPILIYALAAMGLNILTGFAGQLSLGTGAFMGVGAYACYKMVTIFPEMNLIYGYAQLQGFRIDSALVEHINVMIIGALIVFFLIIEPHGLNQLWRLIREKLIIWPFPH